VLSVGAAFICAWIFQSLVHDASATERLWLSGLMPDESLGITEVSLMFRKS
jgi:hypothetical protein